MRINKIHALVGVLVVAGLVGTLLYYPDLQHKVRSSLSEKTTELTAEAEKEISAPGPLQGILDRKGQQLTRAGILRETNIQRTANGQAPLIGNAVLDKAAEKKIADMFAKQYFEHVSPSGVGPADVVESVGYKYIRVGENLALGNFDGDAGVVEAWMNSPGHRENILSPKFSELGVTAQSGMYEGHRVWIAVQTFGLPLSTCPAPDEALRARVKTLQNEITAAVTALETLEKKIETAQSALEPLKIEITTLAEEGNKKVAEGNEKIKEGNRVYKQTGSREEAEPYWNEGEKLQQEGQALLAEAQQKQEEYNSTVATINAERETYNTQVATIKVKDTELKQATEKLNAQITAFNDCAK